MDILFKQINASNKLINKRVENVMIGGCGVYAKYLHSTITKQYKKDVKFVLVINVNDLNRVNEMLLDKKEFEHIAKYDWYHILTVVDGRYIDANYNSKNQQVFLNHFKRYDLDGAITNEFDLKTLKTIIKDVNWNIRFNMGDKRKISYVFKKNIINKLA